MLELSFTEADAHVDHAVSPDGRQMKLLVLTDGYATVRIALDLAAADTIADQLKLKPQEGGDNA